MKLKKAFLLLSIAVAAAACRQNAGSTPAVAEPPANEVWVTAKQLQEAKIVTSVVGQASIGGVLSTTGRVAFSDIKVAHVFSPVTGRVTNILVSLGQAVRRGQPLAMIQSPDMGSAISDLAKAEADFAAAQRDYERQKELYEGHAAAQRDLEAAESTYRKAKAEKERAAQKARLFQSSSASVTQEYTLRSPMDGEIVARTATPGVEVQGQYSGGTSAELFTIGNLNPIWIVADVFEVDLPRVRIGAPVQVHVVAYPDHPFAGRVDWISDALDPVTRTAKLRCVIENAAHLLRPEMFATVAVQTDGKGRLAVPRTAVVHMGDHVTAFVDRGSAPDGRKRFERRIITVDEAEAGDYVPVLSGLQAGEKVVTSGAIILTGAA